MTTGKHIEVKPGVRWGLPVLTGTGLATGVIYSRHMAGETLPDIAEDYDQPLERVLAAFYFELGRRRRWSQEAREFLATD